MATVQHSPTPTSDAPASPVVDASGVSFGYPASELVLDGLEFAAPAGAIVCITGRSGIGKSTLLYCLGGVLQSTGTIRIAGNQLTPDASQRAKLRLRSCGFIFQRGELLPELTIEENAALPLRLLGASRSEAHSRAQDLLALLDVQECAPRTPDEISGGQAQRVSVARSMIHSPAVIFADEPTASLDESSRQLVLDALRFCARSGATIVCATHDLDLVENSDQQWHLTSATKLERHA